MSEQNKSIVQQAYDSFKQGRIDTLLSLMSDNISWTCRRLKAFPFGGHKVGLRAVGEFFVTLNNLQESLAFDIHEMIAAGDRVVALGNYNWRVRHTKREFTSDFAHVWTIRDGKAIVFHEYMDTAAAAMPTKKP